jgi:hypothetical protein
MTARFIRQWPSLGFGMLVASYGLLAAFLAWGFTTPELDRAWRVIQHTREPDFAGLRASELQTLSAALRRHPGLARALAERSPAGFVEPSPDGCSCLPVSHLVLQPTPGQSLRVQLASRGDRAAFPLTVRLRGADLDRTLRFDAPAQMDFVLAPNQPPAPALLTVTRHTAGDPTALRCPVRVCIDAQSLVAGKAAP